MTIIDTTTYLDGQLRLARHGAGRGGTVLTLVETGEQIDVHLEAEPAVIDMLDDYARRGYVSSENVFSGIGNFLEGFMSSWRS